MPEYHSDIQTLCLAGHSLFLLTSLTICACTDIIYHNSLSKPRFYNPHEIHLGFPAGRSRVLPEDNFPSQKYKPSTDLFINDSLCLASINFYFSDDGRLCPIEVFGSALVIMRPTPSVGVGIGSRGIFTSYGQFITSFI